MKVWTELLTPGEVNYVNSIVEQIPEEHCARDSFVGCLQSLADGGSAPKKRYLVCGDGDVRSTDDDEAARTCAGNEELYVVDLVRFVWLTSEDEDDDTAISEAA